MDTRTKIVCTIGPATDSYEKICELIDAGMNVARFNMSHADHAYHKQAMENVKRARKEKGVPIAIMLDTKGPEIRVGKLESDLFNVNRGDRVVLCKNGKAAALHIDPAIAIDETPEGAIVLFDDGYISSRVVEKRKDELVIEILNSGTIRSRTAVNVPDTNFSLPAMTSQDIEDIEFGCAQDVDLIAASFIRSAEHVLEIKRLLSRQEKTSILVIAKIESAEGVEHFDSIVQVADGIMVARGDLGIEMPQERVPGLQKMMIHKCYQAGKPVVTATQMLESMIHNPRPTRAEVSDVANAIYDSTSAVMLSGETSKGVYPIPVVKTMKSIIKEAESEFNYRTFFKRDARKDLNDTASAIAYSAVKTVQGTRARAIFVCTESGVMTRLISRLRPEVPIVALSPNEKTYQQMALNWGVISVPTQKIGNIEEGLDVLEKFSRERGIVDEGDYVVVVAGSYFRLKGKTNGLFLTSIGDVLVHSFPSEGEVIEGEVVTYRCGPNEFDSNYRDKIVVITHCDESYLEVLKDVKGIILQNHPEDVASESCLKMFAKEHSIPALVRADGALSFIRVGDHVRMDPARGVVYRK